jgi:hypothetical protein
VLKEIVYMSSRATEKYYSKVSQHIQSQSL